MQNLRKTQFLVVSFTVAALLPFLNRAFHVDDPLFIWIARQIVKHPSDPYGFNLNWVSFTQPMSIVMQNPPLCSYYIAAVAIVSGWSERSLHLAFLVWAVLSVLGTFAIARRFCRGHPAQLLIGLAFTGGCFFSAIFFWPLFEKRLFLLAATLTTAFTVAFKFFIVSCVYLETSEAVVSLQGGLFATIGTIFLVLAIFDLIQHKNTDSLLLLLWIFGTFFFATFFNWSITARTLLPMTPAVVILTIRQFEWQNAGHFPRWRILPAAILSLVIVSADYQQANCGRTASHFFEQRYRNEPHTTWFQGH